MAESGTRHSKRWLGVASIWLVGLILGACSAAPAAGLTILASTSDQFTEPFPLNGKAVSGSLHIFVEDVDDTIAFVEFAKEDDAGIRQLIRRDYDAPYTPTPDGTPLDLDSFGLGRHVLIADLRLRDGTTATARAEFVVSEPVADDPDPNPEPDPDPEPEPDPTPPESPDKPGAGIWQPAPGTSWQWQLTGRLDLSVDAEVFDIDLEGTSAATIAELHSMGRRVICYFSAGSFEPWRSDASDFPASVKGKKMYGWDELWLDIRQIEALSPIMLARLDMAAAKGCDAVEPDNIDAYQNDTGFPLSGADQIAYNRWLAASAHERGLAIGLKNDLEQVRQLVDDFDFAINEECFSWNECERLLPFIDAGKAVFGAEYDLSAASFCAEANAMNMDFIRKELNLGVYRQACR